MHRSSATRHTAPIAVILALLVGSCQLTRDFSRVELANKQCEVGTQIECACSAERRGTQVCVDGGVYGPCRCSTDATTDGDTADSADPADGRGDIGDTTGMDDADAARDAADADGSNAPTDAETGD